MILIIIITIIIIMVAEGLIKFKTCFQAIQECIQKVSKVSIMMMFMLSLYIYNHASITSIVELQFHNILSIYLSTGADPGRP
jgi:hypothetical protein